jgi:methyl-accepting chemotaxis protein
MIVIDARRVLERRSSRIAAEDRVMDGTTLKLSDIRARATQLFVLMTWFHVGIVAAVAIIARNAWTTPACIALGVALAATLCARMLKDGLALRSLMAVFMTAAPILLVYAGRGHHSGISGNGDWQIDYHMYFFGVFAMLAAYVDWRPIAVAAALTAVHHLVLDLFVPANVFPEEGLDRVLVHALAVVAECGVLFWLTGAIDSLFKRIDGLIDFISRETADQLMREQQANAALREQLAVAQAVAK